MRKKFLLTFALVVLIVLTACSTPTPTPVPTARPTLVPPSPVVPTGVPPTWTPTIVVPPTPIATPSVNNANCVDQATFKGEELPKDYAQFAAKTNFVKQWAVYNTGTCTWDSSYTWVFVSGEQMNGANQGLAQAINVTSGIMAPKSSFATFSIDLVAPANPGTYIGYWKLVNGKGETVPFVGGTKENTLYVVIVVPNKASPTNAVGGIISTTVKVVPEQGSSTVCAKATYQVTVDITSNGPTTAKYEINVTDASGQVADGVFDTFAAPSVSDGLKFAGAETKSVVLRLVGPYSYPNHITIRVRVNGGDWQQAIALCK